MRNIINRHSRDGDDDDSSDRGDRDRGTSCDDGGDDADNFDGDGDYRGHSTRTLMGFDPSLGVAHPSRRARSLPRGTRGGAPQGEVKSKLAPMG